MISRDKFRQKLAQRRARSDALREHRTDFYRTQSQRLVELNNELDELLSNIPKRCFFVTLNEHSLEVRISAERVLSPNPDFLIIIKASYRMRNELDPFGYTFIPEAGFHGSIKRGYGSWARRVSGEPVAFFAGSDRTLLDIIAEEMVELIINIDEE